MKISHIALAAALAFGTTVNASFSVLTDDELAILNGTTSANFKEVYAEAFAVGGDDVADAGNAVDASNALLGAEETVGENVTALNTLIGDIAVFNAARTAANGRSANLIVGVDAMTADDTVEERLTKVLLLTFNILNLGPDGAAGADDDVSDVLGFANTSFATVLTGLVAVATYDAL